MKTKEVSTSEAESNFNKESIIQFMISERYPNGEMDSRLKRFLILKDDTYWLYAFTKQEHCDWTEWLDEIGITMDQFLSDPDSVGDQSDRFVGNSGPSSITVTGFKCDERTQRMLERSASYMNQTVAEYINECLATDIQAVSEQFTIDDKGELFSAPAYVAMGSLKRLMERMKSAAVASSYC